TDGGVVSRSTVTLALPTRPPASRATAVMVFLPSRSGTASAVKAPASSAASTPFTCTETADAETVPVTRTLPWLVRMPSAGAVIATVTRAQSRPSSTSPLQSLSMPSQTSAPGVPGVHCWGTPPTQLSTVRRQALTPQVVWPSPSSIFPLQSLSLPSQTSGLGIQPCGWQSVPQPGPGGSHVSPRSTTPSPHRGRVHVVRHVSGVVSLFRSPSSQASLPSTVPLPHTGTTRPGNVNSVLWF